jgi:SNF2 family DNA or RNA helicase
LFFGLTFETGMVRENVEQFAIYQWDVLVLDEAHTIKKHTNKIYQALFQLKAIRKFLLTATPIMNNLTVDLFRFLTFLHIINIKSSAS